MGRAVCAGTHGSSLLPSSEQKLHHLNQLIFLPDPFRFPELQPDWVSSCILCAVISAQSCLSLCDPMDYIAHQAPLSMGFSRQETWSGLPHPLQMIFPTQGSNLGLPHCRQILRCLSHQGSPAEISCLGARLTLSSVRSPHSSFLWMPQHHPVSPTSALPWDLMIKNPDTGVRSGFKRGLWDSLAEWFGVSRLSPKFSHVVSLGVR